MHYFAFGKHKSMKLRRAEEDRVGQSDDLKQKSSEPLVALVRSGAPCWDDMWTTSNPRGRLKMVPVMEVKRRVA